MPYTQDNRHIAITTPLGKDVLLLKGFDGQEALSQPFRYELELLSEVDPAVDFDKIVGKNVTISILHPGGTRYVNGIVRRFSQQPGQPPFATYRAEVVPWLWLLTQTADCRIFQNMTVPDIVAKVFKDLGFTDFKQNLVKSYQPREYCVQYRETDFNFVSRLMEQYGIYYYFEHGDGTHTMIMGDAPGAHCPCDPLAAPFHGTSGATVTPEDVVHEFIKEQEIRPGKYALTDYNFETPSVKLAVNVSSVFPASGGPLEIYDYPGDYMKRAEGDQLVKLRMEEEEAQRSILTGSGGCRHFTGGYKFKLSGHGRADFDGDYVLSSVRHSAQEHGYDPGGDENEFTYVNTFTCIPAAVPYRPPRLTPKPLIQGAQTAEVVGTKGEEIYTDKFGRVKVQFHWDREGKKDENSSCWIRVSHPWAGKGWGSVSIPRIGQEVIVDFLEGDPDQPLITGRVYNGELMPPYGLPAGGVVSGLKSNSTKGGGGYNEMSMDDTKGKEKIVVHGQYDMSRTILHNLDGSVGNNRTEAVKVNETLSVGNDRKRSVGNIETVEVGKIRKHKVGILEKIDVGAVQQIKIGALQMVRVGAIQVTNVGTAQSTTVRGRRKIKVGGKQDVEIGGDEKVKIKGKRTKTVVKDDELTVSGARTAKITKADKVSAKTITLVADKEIVLQTGAAKITMNSNGDITISGKKVEVKGTQAIEEEAAQVTVKASAVCTIKGGLVKIN